MEQTGLGQMSETLKVLQRAGGKSELQKQTFTFTLTLTNTKLMSTPVRWFHQAPRPLSANILPSCQRGLQGLNRWHSKDQAPLTGTELTHTQHRCHIKFPALMARAETSSMRPVPHLLSRLKAATCSLKNRMGNQHDKFPSS